MAKKRMMIGNGNAQERIEDAIESILDYWHVNDAEAQQAAQVAQNPKAWRDHMENFLEGILDNLLYAEWLVSGVARKRIKDAAKAANDAKKAP